MDDHDAPAADRLGHELSLRVVLFHDALARRLGLTATEHKLLDLIGMHEGTTPTALAKEAGLSNPAITKVVDRLVEAGYVRRERHPGDGRSVRLVRTGGFHAAMGAAYAGLSRRFDAGLADLDEDGRQAVLRWILLAIESLREETQLLDGGDGT